MIGDWLRLFEGLIYPIGLLWLLTLIGLVVLLKKRRWGWSGLVFFVALMMFVIGATKVPFRLLASLERPYGQKSVAEIAPADAVVVLGGIVLPSERDALGFQVSATADRFLTGVELLRRGKAKVLVLGGGGSTDEHAQWAESELLQKWIEDWKMTDKEVVRLPLSINTHDEAMSTAELAEKRKWKSILLVTSASHMARAEAVFRSASLEVTPVAADFWGLSEVERAWPVTIVPGAMGFEAMEVYLHEVIGRAYYSWKGWIKSD